MSIKSFSELNWTANEGQLVLETTQNLKAD